jgi:hypothetical protein
MTRSDIIQKTTQKPTQHERGQAIVLIALGLVVLIAAVGLATDATLIYKAKRDLQRTLDSSALAAAYKLPDQIAAKQAANEFARLHGYNTSTNPLHFDFPSFDPPRKAVNVQGSTVVNFAFLSILGFHTMTVTASGEAEAAPMDVYLVFDLSESMTYDTYYSPPSPLPACSWDYQSDCVATWCNENRKCDPLDIHFKPAAKFFIDQLHYQYDRVGIVAYTQFGTKIIGLTNDFNAVKEAIDDLDAFDHQGGSASLCPNTNPAGCNKQTNIGDGIMYAHNNLASEGRQDAIWSIVLETDGKANVYRSCSGCPPSCGAGSCNTLYLCNECTNAETWAINNAKDTWTRHETVIYTIAFGDTSTDPDYQALLKTIADCTDDGNCSNGTNNFWAAPDEGSLRVAFAEIAQRIYSRLIR